MEKEPIKGQLGGTHAGDYISCWNGQAFKRVNE